MNPTYEEKVNQERWENYYKCVQLLRRALPYIEHFEFMGRLVSDTSTNKLSDLIVEIQEVI